MSGPTAGDLLAITRRHAGFILWNVVGTTAIALVIAVLLPKWYTASATLLPPTEDDVSLALSQLAPRAALGGIRLPGAPTLSDVYLAVLRSRTVADSLIQRFDLVRRFHMPDVEKARKELGDRTQLRVGDEGTISVSVDDREPRMAAALANAYVEELDRFNRLTRTTGGRRARTFIEERLAVTQRELSAAEDRLRDYQQRYRVVTLSPQSAGEAEAGVRLLSQKIALEVKLSVLLQSLSESSEEVRRVREELAATERQIGSLPSTGLEIMRLWRDVRVQEQVYELLTAQLEEARIRETRDTPTVQVLDRATPPIHKSKPKRAVIVIAGLLIGLAGSLCAALLLERTSAHVSDPRPSDPVV